jgi:hypothetical protein
LAKKKKKDATSAVKRSFLKILKEKIQNPLAFFLQHRLISLFILIAIVGIAIIVVLFISNNKPRTVKTEQNTNEIEARIVDLSIVIPQNAFPYPKSFTIRQINTGESSYGIKESGRFTGNIYELLPSDGRNDLSLVPMLFRYNFPSEFYFGSEFNNIELLYVEDDQAPIPKPFSGAEIKKVGEQIVVEAKSFHGSIVGIRVSNPQKGSWGLQRSIEKPASLKPDLLIVPGVDRNFLGFLPNTISNANPQGNNLWEVAFPDRTIWSFSYPLVETHSLDYVNETESFFEKISQRSYIIFEATKLAESLTNAGKNFDVIAHGIGGLIVRYAVEILGVKNVRKIILISTPNGGTNVVNPSFLSLLFGKEKRVLAEIYGLDEDTIRFIEKNNLSYLEKVNGYYTEILPDSQLTETLKDSIRTDVEYAFIGGSAPGFLDNIESSQLAKFYPELTVDKGDGIVSIYSALLPTIENNKELENVYGKVFGYTFYDNYVQKDTLNYIKQFLEEGVEVVQVPEYEDDLYREWSFQYAGQNATDAVDTTGPFNTVSFTGNATPAISITATETQIKESVPSRDIESWKTQIEATSTDTGESLTSSATVIKTAQTLTALVTSTSIPSSVENGKTEIMTDVKLNPDSGSFKLNTYTPAHTDFNVSILPETFYLSNQLFSYPNYGIYLSGLDTAYGLLSASDGDFVFDAKGITKVENGANVRIFSGAVESYTTFQGALLFLSDGILYRYQRGTLSKKKYVGIDENVVSMAFLADNEYYLTDRQGLILETPHSSFKIPGMTGKILLYGVYPYIVSDIGLFLFNGEEIVEIYKPDNPHEHLLDGVLKNSAIYLLSSGYRIIAVSLDGRLSTSAASNQIGGFRLLSSENSIYTVGRSKVGAVFLKSGKPEGVYYDLSNFGEIVDTQIKNGEMVLLVEEDNGYYLRKIGLME